MFVFQKMPNDYVTLQNLISTVTQSSFVASEHCLEFLRQTLHNLTGLGHSVATMVLVNLGHCKKLQTSKLLNNVIRKYMLDP